MEYREWSMDDRIVEAYVRLKALRDHAPQGRIALKFVDELNEVLALLEDAAQVRLGSFRVTPQDIHPAETRRALNRVTRSLREFTTEAYCEQAIFRMRLDGALAMFDLLTGARSSGKPPIGFRPPAGVNE